MLLHVTQNREGRSHGCVYAAHELYKAQLNQWAMGEGSRSEAGEGCGHNNLSWPPACRIWLLYGLYLTVDFILLFLVEHGLNQLKDEGSAPWRYSPIRNINVRQIIP